MKHHRKDKVKTGVRKLKDLEEGADVYAPWFKIRGQTFYLVTEDDKEDAEWMIMQLTSAFEQLMEEI